MRSYSRMIGETSDERLTARSGASAWMIAAARRSCAGFAYAWRKPTATDAIPSLTRPCTVARSSASSSGVRTSPSKAIRSVTSRMQARGMRGAGFSMKRS
jgi:hypothetical protein